jgi:hypothetical protein
MITELEEFLELNENDQKIVIEAYRHRKLLKQELSLLLDHRKALDKNIEDLQKQLGTHASTCEHPVLTGKYGANTGNWSSTDDSYWVDFFCPNCGKRWTEDQDEVKVDRKDMQMKSKEGFTFTKI